MGSTVVVTAQPHPVQITLIFYTYLITSILLCLEVPHNGLNGVCDLNTLCALEVELTHTS